MSEFCVSFGLERSVCMHNTQVRTYKGRSEVSIVPIYPSMSQGSLILKHLVRYFIETVTMVKLIWKTLEQSQM